MVGVGSAVWATEPGCERSGQKGSVGVGGVCTLGVLRLRLRMTPSRGKLGWWFQMQVLREAQNGKKKLGGEGVGLGGEGG